MSRVLVAKEDFDQVLGGLESLSKLSLDSETYGLRPYHGDKLFSIILASSPRQAWYFNFQAYEGMDPKYLLLPRHLAAMKERVFSKPGRLWYIHNAKYDMAILAAEGIELAGDIHCTMAQARVEYNDQFQFGLDAQLHKIGWEKDGAVDKWIEDNGAWEWVYKRGKKTDKKNKFYSKVPLDLMVPYGCQDAQGCFALGESQVNNIGKLREDAEGNPSPWDVMLNERRLTKTVFNMEREGVLVDLPYSAKAAEFELNRMEQFKANFFAQTGRKFSDSPKLFAEVFESEKDRWQYTEKGNPSFDGDVLPTLFHPAAASVLGVRDCKAKYDFYTGFQHHADKQGRVHSNFNQHGANHGRFSSSGPNFQNLSNEEDDAERLEYMVRRAVIPRPGTFLCSIDYKTMEYAFMMDYACMYAGFLTPLAARLVAGEDFHRATADLATKASGKEVKRQQAKTTNFLNLYGGGTGTLAAQLKIGVADAAVIKDAINAAAPEIRGVSKKIARTAETRGYVRNWLGRHCYFTKPEFSYIAPNHLIAGGCADIIKVAMNQIDDLLALHKSKLILNVHDELVLEVVFGEEFIIPQIKAIMEGVYKARYVPLVCSVSTSTKSLADLEDWKAA